MLLKPELLKPERLKRYAEIVALLVKYGRSDLVDQSALVLAGAQSKELAKAPQAEELADDLEKLGPTFIKLGSCFPPAEIYCRNRILRLYRVCRIRSSHFHMSRSSRSFVRN
jgi:hypothetical protein